ncbi:MAG: methyl-accepting chemotaxis protein [Halothiobacillaceae bacterium]
MNLTIRKRLIASVVIPVIVLLLLLLVALGSIRYIDRGVNDLYVDRIEPLAQLKTVVDRYAVSIIDAANKVNVGMMSPDDALNELRIAQGEIDQEWRTYMGTTLTERESRLAAEAEGLFRNADRGIARLRQALEQFRGTGEGTLEGEIAPLYRAIDPISEKISELVALQLEEADSKRREIHDRAVKVQVWTGVLALVGVVLLILVSLTTYLAISRPVQGIRQAISQVVRSRDLTVRIAHGRRDELGVIAQDVNQVLELFNGTVAELNAAISQLAAASEQMSAISSQSTSSMGRQQEETEMVATAMNEMTATVQEVARNAADAAEKTREADSQTGEARRVVEGNRRYINELAGIFNQTTQTIERVHSESDEIGSVIDVIQGIAEQTNLLALNAAIEAARAGEQGRGFAVVAEEVRALASRTQNSTIQIHEMIDKLQKGVKEAAEAMVGGRQTVGESVSRAEQAYESLERIGAAVAAVNGMNMQIASAAEQQGSVAEEINQRVVSISEVGRQTSEAASQSAVASQELAQLAADLQKTAGSFRVD